IDPTGRRTRFEYDTTNNVVVLRRVIDPDGQTSSISYDATYPYQVSQVTDPYGRSGIFSYDSNGILTNITDAASIKSRFRYDGGGMITNLHTPYGDTGFQFTQQAATNGPKTVTLRSADITRPDGSKELFVYRDWFTNW